MLPIDATQVLVTLAAIVGAMITLWTAAIWLWKQIRKGFEYLSGNAEILSQLQDMRKKQEEVETGQKIILGQLKPNGGSSLADAVRRIEANLHLVNARQLALVDDVSHGICETDHDGNIVWVNRRLCRITGRMPSEMMGKGWINILSPEDREKVGQDWEQAIAEEREFVQRMTLVTGAGEKVQVNCHTLKMADHSQKVMGYMAFFTVVE